MTEPATPMSEEVATETAREIIATAFRDDTPVPRHGTTPPVPQPGRPPMSQKAVDTSTIMLSASAATIPPGALAIGVMLASGYADATVIGWIAAAPALAAVPIFAVARLLRSAKPQPDVHHHYEGTVYQDQRNVSSSTRGVWAKTNNQQ
ncbi:hypothetical protein ACFXAS_05660 [Streptomyces sp. NPDC059459]|uniref:hypothetical protein n=1 Tax=Streptomyces sp. NPDC059459 TaxID=3346839 RepID=UPI0036A45454